MNQTQNNKDWLRFLSLAMPPLPNVTGSWIMLPKAALAT